MEVKSVFIIFHRPAIFTPDGEIKLCGKKAQIPLQGLKGLFSMPGPLPEAVCDSLLVILLDVPQADFPLQASYQLEIPSSDGSAAMTLQLDSHSLFTRPSDSSLLVLCEPEQSESSVLKFLSFQKSPRHPPLPPFIAMFFQNCFHAFSADHRLPELILHLISSVTKGTG